MILKSRKNVNNFDKLTKIKLDLLYPDWELSSNKEKTEKLLELVDIGKIHTSTITNFELLGYVNSDDIIINSTKIADVVKAKIFVDDIDNEEILSFCNLKERNFSVIKYNIYLINKMEKLYVNMNKDILSELEQEIQDGDCEKIISDIKEMYLKDIERVNISDTLQETVHDELIGHVRKNRMKSIINKLESKYKKGCWEENNIRSPLVLTVERFLGRNVKIYNHNPNATIGDIIKKHFHCNSVTNIDRYKLPYVEKVIGSAKYRYSQLIPPLSILSKMDFDIVISNSILVRYKNRSEIHIEEISDINIKIYNVLSKVLPGVEAQLALYKHLLRDLDSYKLIQTTNTISYNSYRILHSITDEFIEIPIEFKLWMDGFYHDITSFKRGLIRDWKNQMRFNPTIFVITVIAFIITFLSLIRTIISIIPYIH